MPCSPWLKDAWLQQRNSTARAFLCTLMFVLLSKDVRFAQRPQSFTGAMATRSTLRPPVPLIAACTRSNKIQRLSQASERTQVLIIGAGVAGLAAAGAFAKAGLSFILVEADDGVGGRVRSDRCEGYILDRGFAVFLDGYPESKKQLDFDDLRLHSYWAGSMVQYQGKRFTVADPRRVPEATLDTIFTPLADVFDKVRMALYVGSLLFRPPPTLALDGTDEEELNTEDHLLKRLQLSPALVDRFFRPFLQGVFFQPLSRQSSKLCDFVLQNFVQGEQGACLPERGIGAVSEQLFKKLPTGSVRLNCKVEQIESEEIGGKAYLADGTHVAFEAAVIATEGPEAARLLQEDGDPRPVGASTTVYFGLDVASLPFTEPCLVLNGGGAPIDGHTINTVSFPSSVCPSYAPPGRALASTTIVGEPSLPEKDLVEDVRQQLIEWFGPEVAKWSYLRTYVIRYGQPPQEPPNAFAKRAVRAGRRLYVCGDHTTTPTLNGALGSGARVAAVVCQDLLREVAT